MYEVCFSVKKQKSFSSKNETRQPFFKTSAEFLIAMLPMKFLNVVHACSLVQNYNMEQLKILNNRFRGFFRFISFRLKKSHKRFSTSFSR